MSDEQFNILVSKLNFNEKGRMAYSDFITNFYDTRQVRAHLWLFVIQCLYTPFSALQISKTVEVLINSI